jgi:uncharacterized membrane protein
MSEPNPMASLSALSRNDQIFLGATLFTLIFSFIDFAHLTISGISGLGDIGSTSISAWHGIGTLAGLLILVALVVGAMVVLAPGPLAQLPVSGRVIAVGAAALGFIFFIIRWLTLPSDSFGSQHVGFSLFWGGYVTLILNIVAIVFGYLALRAAGDSMPWENRGGAATPPPPPAV